MNSLENLELILAEIDLLKSEWQLRSPELDEALRQQLDIEYTYQSNLLDGSSLTLRETETVIRQGLMLPGKSMTENLAALNHYQAVQTVRELAGEQSLLTAEAIKYVHGLLSRAIHRDQAGIYRQQGGNLPGGQAAPPPEQLPALMAEHIHWLNLEGPFLHPLVFAAETHLRIMLLQPFPSANGLCARLTMNQILLQEGYPLLVIAGDPEAKRRYLDALSLAYSAADHLPWRIYLAQQMLSGLQGLTAKTSD